MLSPCDPGTITKCYIERNRSGSNFFQPFYSLCADLEDGTGRELIVCRKVPSLSSHYIFSLKQEDLWLKREKRSRLYLGKLRQISSSDYVLYDHGTLSRTEDDADSKSSSSGKGTHSLTHLLTYSLTHSLTHLLNQVKVVKIVMMVWMKKKKK